jgi:short-subunit dehydrogenase
MRALTGKTALVTGASSGIGEAIARKLAAEGVNLVLVARSQDKLKQLADALTQSYAVQCTVLLADLSTQNCGATVHGQVKAMGLTVDILVNNAGYGTYGPFDSIAPENEQAEIAVNIAAVVDFAHAFLPEMLKRGAGTILNVASTAAFQPVPYMAVYAASKAFVLSFSEALWAEYRQQGIHVVALCPSAVDTGFINHLGDESVRKTAAFSTTLQPEQVAAHAMKAIHGKGPTHITGFKNWLMAQSVRFAPRSLVARSSADMMRPPVQNGATLH